MDIDYKERNDYGEYYKKDNIQDLLVRFEGKLDSSR